MPGKKTNKKKIRVRALRSDFKGLKSVLIRLRPDQDAALSAAAEARRKKSGAKRGDRSELVREALDRHPDLRSKQRSQPIQGGRT